METEQEKILVIDDEKPTLVMFRLMLGAYGYWVLTAENGTVGLDLFNRERPLIVLTDIKMPGMDGIEVLQQIKKIDPKTEVIVITGHGDMDLAIKALNLDATDFINKPIQRKALEQALSRAKERIGLAREGQREMLVESVEQAAVIRIQGGLTAHCEDPLQAAYEQALSLGKGKVVFSFQENASINGAGMAILTQLFLDAQRREVAVVIAGLSDNFKKVFDIVGISKLALLTASLEDALY